MNPTTSYCYIAVSPSEYKTFAQFIAGISCINATLIPLRDTIIITLKENEDTTLKAIEDFIESSDLSVHSEPIVVTEETMYDLIGEECVDAATLRAVIDLLFKEQKRVNESMALEIKRRESEIATLKEDLANMKGNSGYYHDRCVKLEEKIKVISGVAASLKYLCD